MARRERTLERQKLILDFIKSFMEKNGYSPTVREIGKATNLSSSSTIHAYLKQLESEGFITRTKAISRSINITENENYRIKKIPLIGTVRAGEPILAEENREDEFVFSTNFIGTNNEIFILRVKGDSMINAGIYEGDLLMVRQQEDAFDGEIVVALVDNEDTTVKRFYREKDRVRLQPENDAMQPIYTKNVRILGKVIGLYRNM